MNLDKKKQQSREYAAGISERAALTIYRADRRYPWNNMADSCPIAVPINCPDWFHSQNEQFYSFSPIYGKFPADSYYLWSNPAKLVEN